jgi:hypothetical protein
MSKYPTPTTCPARSPTCSSRQTERQPFGSGRKASNKTASHRYNHYRRSAPEDISVDNAGCPTKSPTLSSRSKKGPTPTNSGRNTNPDIQSPVLAERNCEMRRLIALSMKIIFGRHRRAALLRPRIKDVASFKGCAATSLLLGLVVVLPAQAIRTRHLYIQSMSIC